MRCLSPRTVGFQSDGKTIAWSQKNYSKEYATFQLPCSKCIECRLEYARQWAVRCVHEAQMHENNSFITLTYNDTNLVSNKLIYKDFQLFMKRLRKDIYESTPDFDKEKHRISVFVTGEYGEQTKRPHWHCLIFNYRPTDLAYKYTSDNGDHVYTSLNLTKLWGKGNAEIGSVTFQSAGYCARYAAKKLVHGRDEEHEFHPISKKSSKNAIGKRFLEKYYKDIFNYGKLILEGGQTTSIPRYYEKWLQKQHPTLWIDYTTRIKAEKSKLAQERALMQKEEEHKINESRHFMKGHQVTPLQMKRVIAEQKFKQLQSYLKGDI